MLSRGSHSLTYHPHTNYICVYSPATKHHRRRSVHARLQVSVCSSYDFVSPWLTSGHTHTQTDSTLISWSQTKNWVSLSYFTGFLGHRRKHLHVNSLCVVLTCGHQVCVVGASHTNATTGRIFTYGFNLIYCSRSQWSKCKNQNSC